MWDFLIDTLWNFSENGFITLLNMSLTGAVVILAVLAARLFLRRAPRIFSYALWAAVLFRLLCPVSFSAPVSLLGVLSREESVAGRMEYISSDVGYQANPQVNLPLPAADGSASAALPEAEEAASVNPVQILLFGGSCVWLLGVLALVLYSGLSLYKLHRRLRSAVQEEARIWRFPGRGTPFVYGILRPRIYLPEHLSAQEEHYILLHEEVHIRRRDPLLRLLAWIALILHWFNPLAWAAYALSGRDMEMSCDEAVIRTLGSRVKKEYSTSLLSFATGHRRLQGMPLAFGENDTKSRIRNVLRYQKPRRILLLAAGIVCAALLLYLAANPRGAGNDGADSAGVSSAEDSALENDGQASEIEDGVSDAAAGVSAADSTADTSEADAAESESAEWQELTEETLLSSAGLNGNYCVYVSSISRSARGFDRYVVSDSSTDAEDELPLLTFSEDCVFQINGSMEKAEYGEREFDAFAEAIERGTASYNVQVFCEFQDNLIVQAWLPSAWYGYGIYYDDQLAAWDSFQETQGVVDMTGEELLAAYFTESSEEAWDISDAPGTENVQVYTGNIGDGESGFAIFQASDGTYLDSEQAHSSRAGWNNIYLGEADGVGYILTVHIEDRDDYGAYSYQVYRFGEDGAQQLIAGSVCEWNENTLYQDNLFHKWADNLVYWLERSHLVLSSQEGELRTEQVCEAEKYNYETLNLNDR